MHFEHQSSSYVQIVCATNHLPNWKQYLSSGPVAAQMALEPAGIDYSYHGFSVDLGKRAQAYASPRKVDDLGLTDEVYVSHIEQTPRR